MAKIGLVVFANDSGLGAQTRRLAELIKPHRVLAIDSSGFSKNKTQHFDWYDGFSGYRVHGFPTNKEVRTFMKGLTHVLVCENPLNTFLLDYAAQNGIKVYIQSNYEFCDHLNKELTLPTKFLMPSFWKITDMKQRFGEERVEYLPPPLDPNEFRAARQTNFARTGSPKFLHVVGTLAAHDRNGTLTLIEAVTKFCRSDFDLTITSQHELPPEYMVSHPRLKYRLGNVVDQESLYTDYDALILPRRYGGLSLSTNEALMSGLPVIMPDISPNNQLLPKQWLVRATKTGEFSARTTIDIYTASPVSLAQKIDWLTLQDLGDLKLEAFDIAYAAFSPSVLAQKYEDLWQ